MCPSQTTISRLILKIKLFFNDVKDFFVFSWGHIVLCVVFLVRTQAEGTCKITKTRRRVCCHLWKCPHNGCVLRRRPLVRASLTHRMHAVQFHHGPANFDVLQANATLLFRVGLVRLEMQRSGDSVSGQSVARPDFSLNAVFPPLLNV